MKVAEIGIGLLASALFGVLMCSPALAKGPDYIVIGGADLAPYYYAIPEPGPAMPGWLGLLSSQSGTQPGNDRPAGMIGEPANSAELLTGAYDLWFEDVPDQRIPNARYVPAVPGSHPAYLYWQTPSGGMDYVAWFTLREQGVVYLDAAIATAKQIVTAGDSALYPAVQKDWIAAEFHSPYYTGSDGPPPIASDTYWISDHRDFTSDMTPLGVVTGADASRLLESYARTLHNWHAVPPGGLHGDKVFTPAGRELFTFVPASADTPARVMPAEAGGVYDADTLLTSIVTGALDRASNRGDTANAPSLAEPSRPLTTSPVVGIGAAIAGGVVLALCAMVVARRRGRITSA